MRGKLLGAWSAAHKTVCEANPHTGNNSRAKRNSSQGFEGNSEFYKQYIKKLNTLITSKFFTGFWFNINPPKISINSMILLKS